MRGNLREVLETEPFPGGAAFIAEAARYLEKFRKSSEKRFWRTEYSPFFKGADLLESRLKERLQHLNSHPVNYVEVMTAWECVKMWTSSDSSYLGWVIPGSGLRFELAAEPQRLGRLSNENKDSTGIREQFGFPFIMLFPIADIKSLRHDMNTHHNERLWEAYANVGICHLWLTRTSRFGLYHDAESRLGTTLTQYERTQSAIQDINSISGKITPPEILQAFTFGYAQRYGLRQGTTKPELTLQQQWIVALVRDGFATPHSYR